MELGIECLILVLRGTDSTHGTYNPNKVVHAITKKPKSLFYVVPLLLSQPRIDLSMSTSRLLTPFSAQVTTLIIRAH